MRISKRKINNALEKELYSTLYQVIADLKTTQEAETVLKDLLKPNELITVVKRLSIAYWLTKGRGVSNIRDNLAVSPATIESIKHGLPKSKGANLAIKKIEAEEWANKWAGRIKKLVK